MTLTTSLLFLFIGIIYLFRNNIRKIFPVNVFVTFTILDEIPEDLAHSSGYVTLDEFVTTETIITNNNKTHSSGSGNNENHKTSLIKGEQHEIEVTNGDHPNDEHMTNGNHSPCKGPNLVKELRNGKPGTTIEDGGPGRYLANTSPKSAKHQRYGGEGDVNPVPRTTSGGGYDLSDELKCMTEHMDGFLDDFNAEIEWNTSLECNEQVGLSHCEHRDDVIDSKDVLNNDTSDSREESKEVEPPLDNTEECETHEVQTAETNLEQCANVSSTTVSGMELIKECYFRQYDFYVPGDIKIDERYMSYEQKKESYAKFTKSVASNMNSTSEAYQCRQAGVDIEKFADLVGSILKDMSLLTVKDDIEPLLTQDEGLPVEQDEALCPSQTVSATSGLKVEKSPNQAETKSASKRKTRKQKNRKLKSEPKVVEAFSCHTASERKVAEASSPQTALEPKILEASSSYTAHEPKVVETSSSHTASVAKKHLVSDHPWCKVDILQTHDESFLSTVKDVVKEETDENIQLKDGTRPKKCSPWITPTRLNDPESLVDTQRSSDGGRTRSRRQPRKTTPPELLATPTGLSDTPTELSDTESLDTSTELSDISTDNSSRVSSEYRSGPHAYPPNYNYYQQYMPYYGYPQPYMPYYAPPYVPMDMTAYYKQCYEYHQQQTALYYHLYEQQQQASLMASIYEQQKTYVKYMARCQKYSK